MADPIKLKGVVSLDGPADLKRRHRDPARSVAAGDHRLDRRVAGAAAGTIPDGSPIELLPLGVRQVFFTGQFFDGHAAPYELAARRAGDLVEVKVYPDADHIAFIDPQSALWPEILRSTRALLSR